MKVKDFGHWLTMLHFFKTLIPHDDKENIMFTDTDLKALLLNFMLLSLEYSYLS